MAKKRTAQKKKISAKQAAEPRRFERDPLNPRRISDEAAAALGRSLRRFGDLSGFVWNMRNGKIVGGHQRLNALKATYGDQVEQLFHDAVADAAVGVRTVVVDDDNEFTVRIVDWPESKHKLANVTANNTKFHGEYTEDVGAYVMEAAEELLGDEPEILADLLLTDLVAELDAIEEEDDVAANHASIGMSFEVIVACKDETHQRETYDRLQAEGYSVKTLTI